MSPPRDFLVDRPEITAHDQIQDGPESELGNQQELKGDHQMDNFLLSDVLLVADGLGLGTGRGWANLAALIGLISLVIGGFALARSALTGSIISLALALAGVVLSGLHIAYSTGGFGTGNGRLGAIVALVLGLIGVAVGVMGLARARRLKPN